MMKNFNRDFTKEVKYLLSRSSGPGGQSVNKLNTKVELRFNLLESELLNNDEKEIIKLKYSKRISKDGIIRFVCSESRSMHTNKKKCYQKFINFIEEALTKRKERKKIKIPRRLIELRLRKKRENAEKKERRKRFDD